MKKGLRLFRDMLLNVIADWSDRCPDEEGIETRRQ